MNAHPGFASARDAPRPGSIAIVSDAWHPQMNGVVRTLDTTVAMLRDWGLAVEVIAPERFRSVPCPTYSEIRLAVAPPGSVAKLLKKGAFDAVHIATEGPLGLAARRWCVRRGVPFTSAYHTQFPNYLARRTGISPRAFWPYIRWFHRPAERVMVATASIEAELATHGIARFHRWTRGVDLALFSPDAPAPAEYEGLARPIQLYVGRVAVEKNIEAFLASNYPGTKVVVGDGPARVALEARFPEARFLGKRTGRALAGCYAHADVFVFPSRTDTFGLVMIEALACGTPVAAYPVAGPVDIVTGDTGALSDDLARAIGAALFCERGVCAAHGAAFTWEAATRQFLAGLAPVGGLPGVAIGAALEPAGDRA